MTKKERERACTMKCENPARIEVYDARQGGVFPDAYDRYTVILVENGRQSVFVMSSHPHRPQGVNMYVGDQVNRDAIGQLLLWDAVPYPVRVAALKHLPRQGGNE